MTTASCEGHLRIVQLLLEHPHLNVNVQDTKEIYTALLSATEKGHIDIVKLLLGLDDIDVNLQDKDGNTALIIASCKGYTEIVQL